jgi:hypothetical protein
MKNMKIYLTLLIAAAFFSTFYFVGCNQSTVIEPHGQSSVTNPYARVGELHNSAFAYILEGLKKDKDDNWQPTNKTGLETKIFNHLNDFNQKMNLDNNNDVELYSIISDHNKNNRLFKSSLFDNVTPEQQYYLDKIDNLIFEIPEIKELQKKLSDLDAEVISSLNEIEAAPILSKSAVALASKTYWLENFETWLKTITGSNQLNKSALLLPEDYASRLAAADAYGAAAGALVAIVSGQWYAVIGMATTGAAYGTAIEVVVILWEIFSGNY